MDHRLFVYATLKSRAVQEQVLKHDAEVIVARAAVFCFKEKMIKADGDKFPTLEVDPDAVTYGEILELSDHELDELDNWEERYTRRRIYTEQGYAWTYIFREPRPWETT